MILQMEVNFGAQLKQYYMPLSFGQSLILFILMQSQLVRNKPITLLVKFKSMKECANNENVKQGSLLSVSSVL